MKKPAPLRRGDSIAIISPSWGAATFFYIYEAGIQNLREWRVRRSLVNDERHYVLAST